MSDLKANVTAAMATASAPYISAGVGEAGPDTPSGDYEAMQAYWKKVRAIGGGADAMRKPCNSEYLPKFELESDSDYKDRINNTPFTNIYEDISGSLASKPFSREVKFEDPDNVDPAFTDLYEDVDGRGNNLHVFAENTFQDGLDMAIDWILVDYTKMPPVEQGKVRSVAEEQELGARPYWVHVAADSVKAVYSAMVRGTEIITHMRISEPTLTRDKYKEEIKERVRVFDRAQFKGADGQDDYDPATWRVEEKQKLDGKDVWVVVDPGGAVPIGIIPAVPFITGKRQGNGWQIKPPMSKLVDMQMDAFRQESNLRNVELLTCYPMLTANGVQQPMSTPTQPGGQPVPVRVQVGPRAVLWAPPAAGGQGNPGSWDFIEPSAESIKVLQGERDSTWGVMREVGMSPMAEANITVITSANVSVKAKSALQAWALRLKDALEQAMVVTALWMGKTKDDAPGIDVYKDFGVDLQSGQELTTLETMAKDGFLSGQTLRKEAQRRNVLSESFNEEEEQELIAEEQANAAATGMGEGDGIDPVTGANLSPDNDPVETPVDGNAFDDSSQIDDDTLLKLFGRTSAGKAA